VNRATNNQAYVTKAVSTPHVLNRSACSMDGWPWRGSDECRVSHGIIRICASKFSTFLYSSLFLAWAYFSAAIIMKFVSCTNINEYLQNYQDCLTLGSNHLDLLVATTSCCNDNYATSWPSSSGLRGRTKTYLPYHFKIGRPGHALFKMVRYVFLRPLRPELDGQDFA
jgi:hypothetical protein